MPVGMRLRSRLVYVPSHKLPSFRKDGLIDTKKLKRATSIAHWGVPVLVVVFVTIYWVLGMINYWSPDIESMHGQQEEQESNSLWLHISLAASGVAALVMVTVLWLWGRTKAKSITVVK